MRKLESWEIWWIALIAAGVAAICGFFLVAGGKVKAQNGVNLYYVDAHGNEHWMPQAIPKPDGKPPRWVPGPREDAKAGGYPHWECDPGYSLDGLRVTWPGGVFTPKPERCKAKEKPR